MDIEKYNLSSTSSVTSYQTQNNDPDFIKILHDLYEAEQSHPFDDDASQNSDDLSIYFNKYSTTVNQVIHIPSTHDHENEISIEQYLTEMPKPESDNEPSTSIEIKYQPCARFRPRTEKESKESSHYIHAETEQNSTIKYPTIRIPDKWATQSNIIQVTLVDIKKQPHPYSLDNKDCKTSLLIFKRENEPNSLYFHVTKDDYTNGEKNFLIEYIKSRQTNEITKELIKTRELDQSMLKFTRFYLHADGTYHEDEASVAYSSVMREYYGEISIEEIFPVYGPLCGNTKVCIEVKGPVRKEFMACLTVTVICTEIGWSHKIDNIRRNGNNFLFVMPKFPYEQVLHAKANIIVVYKEERIYIADFIYIRKLDEILMKQKESVSNVVFDMGIASSNNLNRSIKVPVKRSATTDGLENRFGNRRKP